MMQTHRRDVTSAMYFLVFHCGMSMAHAESVLTYYKSAITPLAEAGREGWKKCEKSLLKFIERAERKRKRK